MPTVVRDSGAEFKSFPGSILKAKTPKKRDKSFKKDQTSVRKNSLGRQRDRVQVFSRFHSSKSSIFETNNSNEEIKASGRRKQQSGRIAQAAT